MRIRVLEWIGLIMADQLAFLVVAVSFLYTFTEPVQEARNRQLAQETIQQQQQQIWELENRVKALKLTLAGKSEMVTGHSSQTQIYVRLFPGDLIVLVMGTGEPLRVDQDELVQLLKERARAAGSALEVVLSAESGVTYEQLTALAEHMLKASGSVVRFGW